MTSFIKGTYSKSIYETNTGYCVGILRVIDTNDEQLVEYVGRTITFTGFFHELNHVDTYLFYGKLVHHEKYGDQFQVESYERSKPEEKESVIDFLSSGLFKGIGEKKASKIYQAFGKDTLKMILEEPSNLILIPTITKKDIDVLHSTLKEYESSYEIIMYLSELGFSTKDSMILYNTYKKKTKQILEEDIYQIIEDIHDLSFKKVDLIALRKGVLKDDFIRVRAAILYIMGEVSNTYGHSYYYEEEIMNYLPRVLEAVPDRQKVTDALLDLETQLKIIHKEDRYYLKEMYEAETLIVKRFRLLNANKEKSSHKILSKIEELEKLFDICYNDEQKEAIQKSNQRDFLIITGGPGTGKTTIMKGICELYRQMNKLSYEQFLSKVALLAPTGRAAKRMSEASLMPASTIHRFLKWSKDTDKFQVNSYNKSKVEMVLIDEASMIDTYLFANLLKGLSSNCKIIIVGDDHQLPSVGAGQVLRDIIESQMLEVVRLKEIYRQGRESNIISLAYDIRNEEIHEEIFNQEDDLTFIRCRDDEVMNTICEIATTYKDVSYKKFQILAPMYKGLNGIDMINHKVQEIYNPNDSNKKEQKQGEVIFRENDKVIQLTNMPDENIYNGDIGLIDQIELGSKKEIKIDFDSNIVKYTPANYDNFRLAYAISIHKSQGSEFDIVVLPIVRGYHKMLYQKLIYTAVTRAKKRLYLIGDMDALKYAVHNLEVDSRRTTIKEYLIHGIV